MFQNAKRETFWAVADQGIFATSNLAISLLLARGLSPSEYGLFVLAYSSFWLFGTVHGAFFLQPLIVLGNGKFRDRFPAYLAALLKTHWKISLFGNLLLVTMGLLSWLLQEQGIALLFWSLSISGPLILFQEIMRRAAYVLKSPQLASYAGAAYLIIVVIGAITLHKMGMLTVASSMGLLGFGSLVSGIGVMIRLGIGKPRSEQSLSPDFILRTHWSFGKWNIGTSIGSWTLANIYYFILSLEHSLEETAALKALLLIFMPVIHTIVAIPRVLTGTLVRDKETINSNQVVWASLLALLIGSALYSILVGYYRYPIVNWLFNGQFDAYANQLWLIGIMPIFIAISSILGAVLQAWERPDIQFHALLRSVLFSLPLGLVLTMHWGVTGAIGSMIFSYLLSACYLYIRWHKLNGTPKLAVARIGTPESWARNG
jgi:O-antigen/teichoic acid export membrane protein